MELSSEEADYHLTVKDLRHAVRCLETLTERPEFLRLGVHSHLLEIALFQSALISFRRIFEDGSTMSGKGQRKRLFKNGMLKNVLDEDQYSLWLKAYDTANGVVAHQDSQKDYFDLRSIEQSELPGGQSLTMYDYRSPNTEHLAELLSLFNKLHEIALKEYGKVYNERLGRPLDAPIQMMELQ